MHDSPFDEGTLTKLHIFEIYTQEWLPVFIANQDPTWPEVHIFDFFAGPGKDTEGNYGSPLRILSQIKNFYTYLEKLKVKVFVHFYDIDSEKIEILKSSIKDANLYLPLVDYDIKSKDFQVALPSSLSILNNDNSACLVIIDQFGVDNVGPHVFLELVNSSTTDFLFFISSSILNRFSDYPDFKIRIDRPDDYYHVHHAVIEYYKKLIPQDKNYYLAPFSIKKGANIYGLVFGSGHPKGMDKFLSTAWRTDKLNGEANFDIHKDNLDEEIMYLPLDEFRPTKVTAFEQDLKNQIMSSLCENEVEVFNICIKHGVTRQHAKKPLSELKTSGKIDCNFHVPQISNFENPRTITLK